MTKKTEELLGKYVKVQCGQNQVQGHITEFDMLGIKGFVVGSDGFIVSFSANRIVSITTNYNRFPHYTIRIVSDNI